jgi:hypothetical protein
MPKTDAVEDKNLSLDPMEAARNSEPTTEIEHSKTPGETAKALPEDDGHRPESDGEDLVAENDPLVLARKEAPKKAPTAKPKDAAPAKLKSEPAKAEPKAENPDDAGETPAESTEEEPAEEAKSKKPADGDATDDPLVHAKLSPETWGKLNHADKSTFLGLQKLARIKAEEVVKVRREVAKVKTDYETVERFVKDQGLEPDAYRNSVIIAGMVARNDARALPALEETVARLRKAAGIQDPPPVVQNPAVDPDALAQAIEEAEATYDFSRVNELVGKLKAKPTAPAATAKAPEQRAPVAPQGIDPGEAAINQSIVDYLTENGVQPGQEVTHLRGLIQANPALATTPVQERLRAVMRAHTAARGAQQQQRPSIPTKPTPTPISGRGRTAGGGRTTDPQSLDPLVQARTGKWRPT